MLIKYLQCDCCSVTSSIVKSTQKELPNWKTIVGKHLCHDCFMIFLDRQNELKNRSDITIKNGSDSLVFDFVRIIRCSQAGMSARTIQKNTGIPLARIRRSLQSFYKKAA